MPTGRDRFIWQTRTFEILHPGPIAAFNKTFCRLDAWQGLSGSHGCVGVKKKGTEWPTRDFSVKTLA